jgi:glycosyltransferase involved in cell wall biosynthesis
MDRPEVGILIPAFNEEATIGEVVSKVSKYGLPIVVNDGSSDQTSAIAKDNGACVVDLKENKGYNQAIWEGFKKGEALGVEKMISIDADGEHDPVFLKDFIEGLDEVEMVIGIRPKKQRFTEVVMGSYFKWKYGVEDILCGFKGYRTYLFSNHGGFESDTIGTGLSLNALKHSCSFMQIPVRGRPRDGKPRFGAKIKGNWLIFKAFLKMLKR